MNCRAASSIWGIAFCAAIALAGPVSAAPVNLACGIFKTTLDESTGRVTHTERGETYTGDAAFAANSVAYKARHPIQNGTAYVQVEIDRQTLAFKATGWLDQTLVHSPKYPVVDGYCKVEEIKGRQF